MKPPVGIDHDRMASPSVFDIFALGEENSEKLKLLLYRLDDFTKLKFSELAEEQNEVEFIKLFISLLEMIGACQHKADPALVDEITYYYSTLQNYDSVRLKKGERAFRELREISDVVKRILARFRLTQPVETPTKTTRDSVRTRFLKYFTDLLGLSRDR